MELKFKHDDGWVWETSGSESDFRGGNYSHRGGFVHMGMAAAYPWGEGGILV